METGKLPFKEFWAMFTRVRPLMVAKEKPGRAGRPKWRYDNRLSAGVRDRIEFSYQF